MSNDKPIGEEAAPNGPSKQWSVQRLGTVNLSSSESSHLAPRDDAASGDSPASGRRKPAETTASNNAGASQGSSIADVGVAQVDLDRARRCGFPEVVFGQGKPPVAIAKIFAALLSSGSDAFATRIDAAQADHLRATFRSGRYNELARTFHVPREAASSGARDGEATLRGRVAIVTAGSSDLPVAEEARETAQWMGTDAILICDVGVAGPQRLQAKLDQIQSADAVVVVAGMEGALPSVVGGHVACPVIAVPTSVGYGASLGGIAALLAMLNSCAANVTVVNIDAGFKGGYLAGMIARRLAEARSGTEAAQRSD
jgi:NCAIR mutase (PurE)-related protein